MICYLSLFLWLSISHAEDLGRYISSEPIKLNDDLTIEAGVTVNFLGVLDVPKNVASSGRLATFYLGENIYNADAALFYRAIESANMQSLCVVHVRKCSLARVYADSVAKLCMCAFAHGCSFPFGYVFMC